MKNEINQKLNRLYSNGQYFLCESLITFLRIIIVSALQQIKMAWPQWLH